MKTVAIVLAAGKGTRMKSDLPKVLHQVGGKPMLVQVLDVLRKAEIGEQVIVLGHGHERIAGALPEYGYVEGKGFRSVLQEQQLGTGHAVMQAREPLKDFGGTVLVVCGDTPLLRAETLSAFIKHHQDNDNAATVLTVEMKDPTGYGRIVRRDLEPAGDVVKIVEQKDADDRIKAIREINTGIYCFAAQPLFAHLSALQPANAQGEYYLTDMIEILLQEGSRVEAWLCADGDSEQFMGVNNRVQLAEAERVLNQRKLRLMMMDGVTIVDPLTTYIDADVTIGRDTTIYPGCRITGGTEIGEGCRVGPYAQLNKCRIGNEVRINSAVLDNVILASGETVPPFTYRSE